MSTGHTRPILSTPDIVEAVKYSVVQIAVTVPGAPRPNVGTGIVFDRSGHILTNYHVVARAQMIKVSLWNGEVMTAQLFREDPQNDLAIIKIESDSLTPAVFGDSRALRVGEDVIAVGHALGLEGGPTVSKGVVSALERAIVSSSGRQLSGLIQTDAAINEGNSGGPLVNMLGQVVGVNSAKMGIGEGVGFALDINSVREKAERLISLGPPPPPGYFGAYGIDIRRALGGRFRAAGIGRIRRNGDRPRFACRPRRHPSGRHSGAGQRHSHSGRRRPEQLSPPSHRRRGSPVHRNQGQQHAGFHPLPLRRNPRQLPRRLVSRAARRGQFLLEGVPAATVSHPSPLPPCRATARSLFNAPCPVCARGLGRSVNSPTPG